MDEKLIEYVTDNRIDIELLRHEVKDIIELANLTYQLKEGVYYQLAQKGRFFFLHSLGQNLTPGDNDVFAPILQLGDEKFICVADIVLRCFDIGDVDLADGAEGPAL